MNLRERNTPHPWSPYRVIAIGTLDPVRWTVQFPNGELHSARFARSQGAEDLAMQLKLMDSRRAATCC